MSKNHPLVSIIIPCYNLGEFIEEAVESVEAQTFSGWELIIVDDGSTDIKTTKILRKIKKNHPEYRIIFQKNVGLSTTRNNGIKQAKSKYIVCLDSDDKLHPEFLEKTVGEMDRDKKGETGFVTTWLKEFGDRSGIWKSSDYDISQLMVTNVVHAGSLFRKEAWEKTGGYKSEMKGGYEDWEFWISIVEAGYKWSVVPETLFFYRIRGGSMLAGSKKMHMELYQRLQNLHEQIFAAHSPEIITRFASELQDLRNLDNAKATLLQERDKTINSLEKQLLSKDQQMEEFKIKAKKYDDLYASRITLIAVKLVKLSGYLRRKIPAGRRKVRRIASRMVPAQIKRVLRGLKRRLFPKKVVVVANERWHSDKPLVSVVTPYYNHGETILETVSSVLSQTFRDIEYIIVNDGSDLENTAVLKEIEAGHRSIKFVHHDTNIGKGSPAAARNDGITHSSGKYIICLDSDDILDPTYIEKCVAILESRPWLSVVTTDTITFGSMNENWSYTPYDPIHLLHDNMVTTAAMFRKDAWSVVGGYKEGIGYEDWEFWINLAENGHWGTHIDEGLFKYRTAEISRYIEDQKKHRDNLHVIKGMHPDYLKKVRKQLRAQKRIEYRVEDKTAFINLSNVSSYHLAENDKKNVLIAIPWMTFGGAETLIYNFCKEVMEDFDISFVTGIKDLHEWEYKFKEISPRVYHLPNMFIEEKLNLEFISNYIKVHNIHVLHIIHTSFMFELLPKLKERHPELKVAVTVFNDRAHFKESLAAAKDIDVLSTDNSVVATRYEDELKKVGSQLKVKVIPNGVDSELIFNPSLFDRSSERAKLGLTKDELAVFFIGRLSEEKNPDVFIKTAKRILVDNRDAPFRFYIIGDGQMKHTVEQEVGKLKSTRVQYLGYQTEIARYLSAADVFVLPSSIEGFPLSILEAMAMRVAVVASDVGAVGDVITSGVDGFIVKPGSDIEISKTLELLTTEPQKLEKVKQTSRESVDKKYSNTILGENYKSLYNKL